MFPKEEGRAELMGMHSSPQPAPGFPACPQRPSALGPRLSAARRGLREWAVSAREDGARLSPPPAPGQWGRSSRCPGQRPPWEVDRQGPKAFPADLIEPQEPAPGGGVWGGEGRASSSSAHSWNAQVRADLAVRVSPRQAIFLSPFASPAPSRGTWGTLYRQEHRGLRRVWVRPERNHSRRWRVCRRQRAGLPAAI